MDRDDIISVGLVLLLPAALWIICYAIGLWAGGGQ